MKKKACFTLVELLLVIGIIIILTGLIFPAVIGAQQKGRITRAKYDMAAIALAVKQVEATYGKMFINTGTASAPEYKFAGKDAYEDKYIKICGKDKTDTDKTEDTEDSEDNASDSNQVYDAFIAELSAPSKVSDDDKNINTREIKFLDPRPDFNPTETYNAKENRPRLWRDPWGNRYIIYIDVSGDDSITIGSKTLSLPVAIYSRGPNKKDDNALNPDNGGGRTTDDVTSW